MLGLKNINEKTNIWNLRIPNRGMEKKEEVRRQFMRRNRT